MPTQNRDRQEDSSSVTQKGTQLAIMNASSRIATTLSGFFALDRHGGVESW